MNLRNIAINSTMAASGLALWSFAAGRLAGEGEFDYHPNPLGLKMSPYGQVIALAVQGGIDSDWNGVETASFAQAANEEGSAPTRPANSRPASWLDHLEFAATERTNPRPASEGHKFYLRRQVEDRLRLAYELDPSNYANYNSYSLFLTEPAVGTRRVLTDKVLTLARVTIDYCLREESDPRPALTAAAASGNILELMFLHRDQHSLDEMKEQLRTLDSCLLRHRDLATQWIESGDFQRLSVARQHEMLERLHFVTRVREAAERTIQRLSASAHNQTSLSN